MATLVSHVGPSGSSLRPCLTWNPTQSYLICGVIHISGALGACFRLDTHFPLLLFNRQISLDVHRPPPTIMQSMQRQFGKLWNKGPGDNAKVSVLLNDYEDADKVLAKVL